MSIKLYPLHSLLPIGPFKEPLSDFILIHRGTLSTVYGDFFWDDKSAELVSKAWSKRNRRFMWDYQHLSDKDGRPGSDGKPTAMASVHDRRAAGSSTIITADSQGFRIHDQRWTPDAKKYIADEEYIYYSPVIAVDEKSKPPGRIVDVLKSSLTNDPAMLGCAPLVALSVDDDAAASEIEEMTMPTDAAASAETESKELAAMPVSPAPPALTSPQPSAAAPHPHGAPAKRDISAVLVRRESDGHTLWGRRNDSNKYTSPGGRVKKDERPVDAASRELREEAGLDVPSHALSYMGTVRCATPEGSHVDVHGYHCSVPDHVAPTSEKDPDREVKGWEFMAEHPLAEMHAPRNALSVLSARHEHLNFSKPAVLTPNKDSKKAEPSKQSLSTAQAAQDKGMTQPTATTSAAANSKVIGSTDNMDIEKARALTLSLLGGLPSLSGDGISADVATKAQAAIDSLTALDASLAAAGASDAGISVAAALSLCEVAMEITGSKDLIGMNGKLYSLQERAQVAPVALQLSDDQAKRVVIEKAFSTGRISGKAKAEHLGRIVRLSLADCQHIASGPKLYDVPSTEPAPVGANSTQVSLTDATSASKGNAAPINAAPSADLTQGADKGKTFELSEMHMNMIRDIEREMPAGMKIPLDKVAAAVAARTPSTEQPRMKNPTA